MDNVETEKVTKNKEKIKNIVLTNTIQYNKSNISKNNAEIKQKIIERVKIDAQIAKMNQHKVSEQINQRLVAEQHADEVKQQHSKLLQWKDLEKRSKIIEEKNALKSNIENLDKMHKRYRNIFNVIEKKQSEIQKTYSKLGAGRNNLAKSEVDKNWIINSFIDKQIIDSDIKINNQYE